jgi:hypothetical protein
MTIDEYWAAVRRLGLRLHTGNIYVTSTGDFHFVQDPTNRTPEERADMIEKLKVLERFPVIWKRVGWAKRCVPTKGRALVGTARKSAPLPTLHVIPIDRNPL